MLYSAFLRLIKTFQNRNICSGRNSIRKMANAGSAMIHQLETVVNDLLTNHKVTEVYYYKPTSYLYFVASTASKDGNSNLRTSPTYSGIKKTFNN